MRRLLWMAAGAGLTIYVLRRSKAGLGALLPSGKHAADTLASNLATGAADFVTDFRSAMATREAELRAAVLNENDPAATGGFARRDRAAVRNRDWAAYDRDDLNDASKEPLYEF